MAVMEEMDEGRKELEGKREENIIQSNEIARLNVKICELVKANKGYEDQVKELEKNASKWKEGKAELDSFVQSLDAAKKKMDAEKVSKTLELSSTKVELELAKRQGLSTIKSKECCQQKGNRKCPQLPNGHHDWHILFWWFLDA